MKIAYLDCFSGVSGDMFLGALLDAGLSLEGLREALGTLPFEGYDLEAKREARNHIQGTRFLVKIREEGHRHRDLAHIREIIRQGGVSQRVKDQSIRVFEDLAAVEGKIHHVPAERVRFHEVGALDSIIDIVGTVYGLEALGIRGLFASPLPMGSGFVSSAHGRIPLPAPATVELLKGVPVFDSGLKHEMVTPTGAALLKGLGASFGPMPPMVIHQVGYGAGSAELADRPNLLRLLIGDPQPAPETDTVVLLETNLDDIPPEWMGFLMERLFEAGALDVVFFPVQMKKNRPGVQVQVMGRPDQKERLEEILFRESATLGIRFRYTQRQVREREMVEVESPWGRMAVKKVTGKGKPSFLPEYAVCRDIALRTNQPLREIYYWVMALNHGSEPPAKPRGDGGKTEDGSPG